MGKLKLTQDDKDEIAALAYLLEKYRARVGIIMFGCIHVPETIEHDEEHHGIKVRAVYTNTNAWPYQADSGK